VCVHECVHACSIFVHGRASRFVDVSFKAVCHEHALESTSYAIPILDPAHGRKAQMQKLLHLCSHPVWRGSIAAVTSGHEHVNRHERAGMYVPV